MQATQNKLPKSQIEITFELSADEFSHFFDEALEHLKNHVKVDGFREGKAPASMVEGKLKPEALLMEAGDIAVKDSYVKYIKENKLEPVGNPEISIVKIAKGNPFIFKAVITILPDVELPDYKEIAKNVKGKEIYVTEQEIEDSIKYLQNTRAKFTLKNGPAEKTHSSPDGSSVPGDFVDITYQNKDINENKPVQDKFVLGDGGFMPGFEDNIVGMKDGDEKTFVVPIPKGSRILDKIGIKFQEGLTMEFKVKMISVQKMELPEINDEFAKSLGVPRPTSSAGMAAEGLATFDTLVALKESVKTGITAEKTEQEKQRKRGEILEKISEKVYPVKSAGGSNGAGFEMPEILIEQEQQRLLEDLKNKVAQAFKNVTFSAQGGPASGWEEYLASIKKTEAEIKETFQKEAEKRLSGFLVLRELGKKENIEVSEKEVEEEVEKSLKNYNLEHAGHNHGEIDKEQLKEYTKGVIYNEKVFQILENLS